MARSASRITQRNILGALDFNEVLVLRIGLDVVLHFVPQGTSRVVQHPQAPQGILHHVAHDPVGRKQLCCRTDGVRCLLGLRFEECVFDLGIVELIHPAQGLDVFPRVSLNPFD